MSQWSEILSAEQLAERTALTAKLDPTFARRQHEFYSTQPANRLRSLQAGAFTANDAEGYQLARSYLAQIGG